MEDPVFSINFTDPKILITINCNNPDCKRALASYNQWGLQFEQMYPQSKIFFVSTQESIPSEKLILVDEIVHNENCAYRQMFYNNYKAYKFFLIKTNYEWILRTTEDVFIFHDRLISLISKFSKIKKKPIFAARFYDPNNLWAHGGPGWIMNRNATMIWIHNEKEIRKIFDELYCVGDDVMTKYYFMISNITNDSIINMPEFVGYPLEENYESILNNKEYSKIPICENLEFNMNMTENIANNINISIAASKVAIWHGGTKQNSIGFHGREILSNLPPNLYVVRDDEKSVLCFHKNIT